MVQVDHDACININEGQVNRPVPDPTVELRATRHGYTAKALAAGLPQDGLRGGIAARGLSSVTGNATHGARTAPARPIPSTVMLAS